MSTLDGYDKIRSYRIDVHMKIFWITEEMTEFEEEDEEWQLLKAKYDALAEVWRELGELIGEG